MKQQILKAFDYGFNLRQLLTMLLLNDAPDTPITPTEIAKELGVTTASVSIIIEKLANMHIVRRQPTTHDRRAVLLSLTQHGRDVLTEITTGGQHLTLKSYEESQC